MAHSLRQLMALVAIALLAAAGSAEGTPTLARCAPAAERVPSPRRCAHFVSRGSTKSTQRHAHSAAAGEGHVRWSPPQRLAAAQPQSLVLAGDGGANRVVAWPTPDGVRVAFARAGGRFGSVRLITTRWAPSHVHAAIDARGRAVVLWTVFDDSDPGDPSRREGPCCVRAQGTMVARRGDLRGAVTLSRPGINALPALLEMTRSGRTAIADQGGRPRIRFGSTRRGFGGSERLPEAELANVVLGAGKPRIDVREYDPDSLVQLVRRGPGRYVRVSRVPFRPSLVRADARGREVLVRERGDGDGSALLDVATRGLGSGFRATTLASYSDAGSFTPLLDVAGTGAAAVFWRYTGYASEDRVWASLRAPGSGFRSPRLVHEAVPNADPDSRLFVRVLDASVAGRGGAAVAVQEVRHGLFNYGRVVVLAPNGRVRGDMPVSSSNSVQDVDVLADHRGVAALWSDWNGLYVARGR